MPKDYFFYRFPKRQAKEHVGGGFLGTKVKIGVIFEKGVSKNVQKPGLSKLVSSCTEE